MESSQARIERMRSDVLIVGAGLSGSTLGFLLRQSGKDVLAVELRDANDKDKLCAGVMESGSITLFDRIYGSGAFEGLSPLVISDATYRCLDASFSGGINYRSLPRKRLDDYCLQRYLDETGRLIDRASLVGIDEAERTATFLDLRGGGRFEVVYNTLVGADGATSAVRRLLSGRNQHICPSMQGTVPVQGFNMIFEYHLKDQGYCWYIPHREDATVGCMLHGATGQTCRRRIEEFCAALGIGVPPLRGAPIPEGDDVLLRAGEEAWLVGDAAGLIDAYGGGGIWLALRSAVALSVALDGGTPYERALENEVARVGHTYSSIDAAYTKTCLEIAAKYYMATRSQR